MQALGWLLQYSEYIWNSVCCKGNEGIYCPCSLGLWPGSNCCVWVSCVDPRFWSPETYSWGWVEYTTSNSTCSFPERLRHFLVFWPVLSWMFLMTRWVVVDPALTWKYHSCKLRSSSRFWNLHMFLPKVAWSGREYGAQKLTCFENVLSTATRARGCLVGRWLTRWGGGGIYFGWLGFFLNRASVLSD